MTKILNPLEIVAVSAKDRVKGHEAVQSVDDGGPGEFFVNLKKGWEWSGQRSFGVDNATQALRMLKQVKKVESSVVTAGRKPPGPPGVGRVSPLTRKLLAPRGTSDKPWKNSPPPPPAKKAAAKSADVLAPLIKEFYDTYREYHPVRGIAGDVETGLKYRLEDLMRDLKKQPQHAEQLLRDEIDDMRRAMQQVKPAKSNMLYPDMVPVPEGKIRIDDTGLWRKYPSNRETIKEQRVDGPQIRGTVKLQYFTRGFEPAGSVSRWTESGWSVRWMDERMNSYQGRIFKDDDQGEAKARAYFDVVTNNGKPGEAAAKEKFKKLGGYDYGTKR